MKPSLAKQLSLYDGLISHLAWPQSVLLLGLRLVWGWGFFQTGKGKLMHIEGVTHFFASLGIPAPKFHAVFVGLVESGCGLALLFGILARFASVPLAITLIVAYATAERDAVRALGTADWMDFFKATPWSFLLSVVIVMLFGPGKLSVDALLKRRFRKIG